MDADGDMDVSDMKPQESCYAVQFLARHERRSLTWVLHVIIVGIENKLLMSADVLVDSKCKSES